MKRRAGDPDSLRYAFDAFVDRHELLPADGPVVVAVSGGIDSVVLLDLLSTRVNPLHVCHVNYGLRGEDSEADEAFVRDLAARYGAPLHIHHENPRATSSSVQAGARRIRYAFFDRIAHQIGSTIVAVGHNLDDQAESVLLSLFRGAGPRGLRGMQARRRLARTGQVMLVRPLLTFDRSQIAGWAQENGLVWREDTSNTGTSYKRNALRHKLFPVLKDLFGTSTVRQIARFGSLMAEYSEMEDHLVAAAKSSSGGVVTITLKDLDNLPRVLRGRAALDALEEVCPDCTLSHDLAGRIVQLRDAQVGRRIVLGDVTVVRDREMLVFQGPVTPFAGARLPVPGFAEVPHGRMEATVWQKDEVAWHAGSHDTAFLDASLLPAELEVRRWKRGDRMRPLGSVGSKKVSDLLTDARVDHATRAERLVVLAGSHIVWVAGVCTSDTFKVRGDSRLVIQLRRVTDPPGELGRKNVS